MAAMSPCLHKPIQGIKELVDTGISYVPHRYIRPPQDRPPMSQASPSDQLPAIDFEDLVGDGRKRKLEEVATACQEWGFFQVLKHGVRLDAMRRLWEAAGLFFREPAEARMRLYSQDLRKPVAYMTSFNFCSERFSDWKDSLVFRCFPGHLNAFEDAPHYCRAPVMEYLYEMRSLATSIYRALSESLGLPTNCLESRIASQDRLTMTIHYYPPCPDPSLTWGFSEHSDPNSFTIILQDDVGGLEVLKDGKWIAVKSQPAALIVNLGDQIQIMTNGRYKSVQHRVVTNKDKPRMSVACFFCPSMDAKVGPLAQILDQDQMAAIYKETVFREYMQHFNKLGLAGKACLEYARV